MNTGDGNCPDGITSKRNCRDIDREGEEGGRDAMEVDLNNAVDNNSVSNRVEKKTMAYNCEVRESMLNRVAATDAYFKQQLLTDPDLTFSEKFTIASELLDRKPATFLERYGKYLLQDDLLYFEPFRSDYFVDFHLHKLARSFSVATSGSKKIKNRRYEAMKRLITAGEYFSDEEMKKRDPLLFEEMIGQFQTNEDVAGAVTKSDLSLSEVLLRHLQAVQNNELYDHLQQQKMEEDEVRADAEELDSDDSEEESEDLASDKEKANLRTEFLEIMQQRFLSGQDDDFDYDEVDNSEEYDSFDLFNRDEEDRYFGGDYSDDDSDDDSDNDFKGDANS